MSKHEIDAVMALLRSALDALEDLKKGAAKDDGGPAGGLAGDGRRLAVPWLSQLGPEAAYSNADCGPACVAMWLRSLGQAVTVDQVSRATGLPPGYRYTVPTQLIKAADLHGLKLRREFGLNTAMLLDEVLSGSPVLVLVHYPGLKRRFDPKFQGGHYILIVGHTERGLLYHDPYWPDTTGQYLEIEDEVLDAALEDCGKDGNTARQGLVKG